MASSFYKLISSSLVLFVVLDSSHEIHAFSLVSTHDTLNGTGEILGPGRYEQKQALFEMVLNDLSFTNRTGFVVPFFNNGEAHPNACAESILEDRPDGRLSNGTAFNENADMCLANIAGTDMHIAVVKGGPLQGQVQSLMMDEQSLLVAMDIAFDLGIGEKGVVAMPFYGSTNKVEIPYSLQTQLNMPGGTDRAGVMASGTWLHGRLGDMDNDGWMDGTLVSAGNIPLESPVFPGQPYAMVRHFELDIPVIGYELGDVQSALKALEDRLNRQEKIGVGQVDKAKRLQPK